jgi:signal transduction histidine kinase
VSGPSSNIYKYLILSIILFLGYSNYAQNNSNRQKYVNDKLQRLDSLIENKKYDQALTLINNIKNTFTLRKNDKELYAFDFRYAEVLFENGEKEKALNLLLNGHEKLKAFPDSPLTVEYLNYITKIFANSKNFEKALYYNKKAFNNAFHNKDTVNQIKSLIRSGSFYFARNQLDSAKIYYKRVIFFKETPKTEQRIANAYNNLGVIYQYENNIPISKYYAQKAIEIKRKQNDLLGVAYIKVNMGNLDHYSRKYNNAIKSYNEAMFSIEKDSSINAKTLKRAIYKNLAVSYDSLGDYKDAYNYLLKSTILKDELVDTKFSEDMAEVEAKYNISKHEHKAELEKYNAQKAKLLFLGLAFLTIVFIILALIFYKNYKLQQQNKFEQVQNENQTKIINATIDAKEKERKKIAEVLHDSVSALLSSVNLHIQASKSHLNSNVPVELTKAQNILGEASTKIRDLSHQLISSVLLKFGLAFAVHDICQKYSNSEIEFTSSDNGIKRYNQKFEIKIYNIIEELINNIIKHSKAKHARINLIERYGNQLIIQIIDDGVGFDVKKARKKDGLGLSHIEARVKVMQGVFNINSKKGEGTSIFISVPIFKVKKENEETKATA